MEDMSTEIRSWSSHTSVNPLLSDSTYSHQIYPDYLYCSFSRNSCEQNASKTCKVKPSSVYETRAYLDYEIIPTLLLLVV